VPGEGNGDHGLRGNRVNKVAAAVIVIIWVAVAIVVGVVLYRWIR